MSSSSSSASPPHLFVVAVSAKGRLECWNLTQKKRVCESSFSVNTSTALALSTDSNLVCLADDRRVDIFRLLDGLRFGDAPLHSIELASPSYDIAFFPMSPRAAVIFGGSAPLIIDAERGEQVASFRDPECPHEIRALSISKCGRYIATYSGPNLTRSSTRGRCFHVFDSTTFEVISKFDDDVDGDDDSNINVIAWFPCGSKLIAGGYARCADGVLDDPKSLVGHLRVWVPAVGRLQHDLRGHKYGICAVAVSGSMIASCSNMKELFLWDCSATGIKIAELETGSSPSSLTFSPDSKSLLLASRKHGIVVYDVAKEERIASFLSSASEEKEGGVTSLVVFDCSVSEMEQCES